MFPRHIIKLGLGAAVAVAVFSLLQWARPGKPTVEAALKELADQMRPTLPRLMGGSVTWTGVEAEGRVLTYTYVLPAGGVLTDLDGLRTSLINMVCGDQDMVKLVHAGVVYRYDYRTATPDDKRIALLPVSSCS